MTPATTIVMTAAATAIFFQRGMVRSQLPKVWAFGGADGASGEVIAAD